MRYYTNIEWAPTLRFIRNICNQVEDLVNQAETDAMASADSGANPLDANAIGRALYKRAGQLMYEAIVQLGEKIDVDVAALVDAGSPDFTDLRDNGFAWPTFAKVGSPDSFQRYTGFAYDGADSPDANLPVIGNDQYAFVAFANNWGGRLKQSTAGTSSTPNPWEVFSNPDDLITTPAVFKLAKCDLTTPTGTQASTGTSGDMDEEDTIFSILGTGQMAADSGNIEVQDSDEAIEGTSKYHAWEQYEKFVAFDYNPKNVTKLVSGDKASGTPTNVADGYKLMIRLYADAWTDLQSK